MSIFRADLFEPTTVAELKAKFDAGQPYRNLSIQDLLAEDFARTLVDNFPGQEAMRRHYQGLNEKKSEGSNFDQYHESFDQLRKGLATPEFLRFLEQVTGIDGLILPDDHRGTGVHQGVDGSFLDVHVDFSVHPVKNIHRRLNLLIFLVNDWKEEYGGALELWNEDVTECVTNIYPGYNKAAIFETSDVSYHGYSTIILPEGVTRNSFFSYFYTPIAEGEKVKYHDTIFKARPEEGTAKAIKTNVKEGAKNFVKGTMKKLGLNKIFDKIE